MTVAKATRRITKLRVREMSLVGEGDNPHADVLILKHRQIVGVDLGAAKVRLSEVREGALAIEKALSEGGSPMTNIEELTQKLDGIEKALTTAQEQNTALTGQVAELTGKLDTVTKERDQALADVEKAKAGKTEGADEDVLKSLPEPLRARFVAAEEKAANVEKQLAEATDKQELAAEVEKVRGTGLADADKFGALIHRVRKGKSEAADADALVDLISKAGAVAKAESVLFTSIGKAKGDENNGADAEAKLNEAVTAIQKAKPNLTKEQAYLEACEANPALYDEVQKAKRA